MMTAPAAITTAPTMTLPHDLVAITARRPAKATHADAEASGARSVPDNATVRTGPVTSSSIGTVIADQVSEHAMSTVRAPPANARRLALMTGVPPPAWRRQPPP